MSSGDLGVANLPRDEVKFMSAPADLRWEASYHRSMTDLGQNDTTALLLRALTFAAERHRDQRRKDAGRSPYINHPIKLARVLCLEGGVVDVVVLCSALLHDTIEDTDTRYEELWAQFGEEIAGVVSEVTDDKSLDKNERKRLQIEHAPSLSPRAKLVKLADKICNLRDIAASPPTGWDDVRKNDYFDWARKVVDGLRGVHPQLEAIFDSTCAAWSAEQDCTGGRSGGGRAHTPG